MDAALKIPPPRRALLVTALAPVVPQLLGSAFNIWYNLTVVQPLLGTAALEARFLRTCLLYNAIVYPIAMFLWLRQVYSIGPVVRMLASGVQPEAAALAQARRRIINLPWRIAEISGAAWLLCVPVFLISLGVVSGPLDHRLLWHLPISFLVSAFISVTHSIFLVELASHWGLFPALFRDARADLTPGGHALSLRGRGLLWAISAGICPIGSLLLLSFAPPAPGTDPAWFAVFVGTVGVAFGLCTAVMISRLVSKPSINCARLLKASRKAGSIPMSTCRARMSSDCLSRSLTTCCTNCARRSACAKHSACTSAGKLPIKFWRAIPVSAESSN